VTERSGITLCRAAKRVPLGDDEYLTWQEKKGDPPPHYPEPVRKSWDALSSYDTEERMRAKALENPRLGKFIIRYNIPAGAGVSWTPSIEEGHYDLRGDKEELERYRDPEYVAHVKVRVE